MDSANKQAVLFSQAVALTTALVSNIESEEVMRLITSIAGKPAGLLTFDDLFTDIYEYLEKNTGFLSKTDLAGYRFLFISR